MKKIKVISIVSLILVLITFIILLQMNLQNKKTENSKQNKISELEIELQDLNICRTKRNIDLQKYIMLQIERRKDGKTSTKKKV